MALGKAAASWRSWVSRDATSLKLQAFTGTNGVPCDDSPSSFPVMVRITEEGSSSSSKSGRHVGVDIVAVLDISGSMLGDKLERTKEAMIKVIERLGPDDRLSIVSFESNVYRLTELTYMSDQGRIAARDKIKELFTKGGTNMGPALHEGAQILRGRPAEEKSSRVGCIVFLSDGLDGGIFEAPISSEFPAHTFGLGDDHDPKAMKHIADKTSGTYSFVNKDPSKIDYAFSLFIAGVTSAVAMSVEIALRTHEDVSITKIESGGYPHETSSDKRSGTICIDNMYAGDKKNFMVYLRLPKVDQEGKQKVLTVGGQYLSLSVTKQMAGTDVSVMRPPRKYSSRLGSDGEVDKELARIKLVEDIDSLQKLPNRMGLEVALNNFKKSTKDATTVLAMENEVRLMKEGIDNPDQHKKLGLPYMLSWLSSHKWQRATTKDAPSDTAYFLTPGQKDVKDPTASATPDTAAAATGTPIWEKAIARARSKPCSCLLPSVAVALLVASLFLAMVYSALVGSSKEMNLGPLQYPMLAESNYAAWAIKMETYMRAQGVWDAVVAKDDKVCTRKNQMALAAIYEAIPEGTLFLLSQKKTAKSVWEALKTMHIGNQRLRDAKLQTLKLEFEGLRMKETESVDDFAVRLATIVNKIQALGEHIEETYAVKKFLRAVPNKFLQIASTIEQFGDLNTMTLQEVIGRLKVHEERLGRLSDAEKETELLTRAEWKAREEADSHDASVAKVCTSVAKILGRADRGCGRDTYRVSASVAKTLDILLTSVLRKEREVKALPVEVQGKDELTLRF